MFWFVPIERLINFYLAFSLEELGMRALQSLPRDRALDGIRAFNEMRCVRFNSITREASYSLNVPYTGPT